MASYDYGSPSPSPPPADIHARNLQRASLPDRLLELRRRANDGPADGHSRHREREVEVIDSHRSHLVEIIRDADGTTTRRTLAVLCTRPLRRDDAYPQGHHHHHRANTAATPYRRPEHHRANTTATPYQRPKHHERWSDPRPRRPPAPHEYDDDEGATKVVCLTKMLSPGDRLEDDGFYWDFREDVTEDARKFGHLAKVVIPRPRHEAAPAVVAGVGKVFLEYVHLDDAAYCRRRLDGMCYNGKEIAVEFFPQAKFAAGDYE